MQLFRCAVKLPYGIIAKRNNKIVDFIKDAEFSSVQNKKINNFTGYVYSGMSILKKNSFKKV